MTINALETIKKVLNVKECEHTDCVHHSHDCHIHLVDEEKLQKEGNTDNIHVENCNKRNEAYKRLEPLCAEYRMDLETLKKMYFIEEICGKPVERLTTEEFDKVMNAIEGALTRDWKVLWKNRDENDITDIMASAKHQYNRSQVGGNLFGQTINNIRTKKTLNEELVSKGIINEQTDLNSLTDEDYKQKIREYINKEFIGNLSNCSEEQKEKIYKQASRRFVYFINKFETDREKILLTAAIDEMASEHKALLTKILINSCGCDEECREQVAKSAFEEVDTTKKDALNKTMSQENATEFYNTTYSNMDKEDVIKAKENLCNDTEAFMNRYGNEIENLKRKKANGETLSIEEEGILLHYENKIVAQNAGATIAIPQNNDFSRKEAEEIVNDIIEKCGDLNIEKDVLNSIKTFAEKHPENFTNMTKEEFTKLLDKITDGQYSQTTTKKDNTISKKEKVEEEKNFNETKDEKVKDSKTVSEAKKHENSKEIGFATNPINSNNESITADKISENNNQSTKEEVKEEQKNRTAKPKDFAAYVKKEGKTKGLTSYIQDYGTNKGLTEAITNLDITNKNAVKRLYKQENDTNQLKIIQDSGTALKKPLEWSKDSTILKLDGKILCCHFATTIAQESVRELKAKENHT